ncbi:MAG: substrate-binding domain-containing protein [Salaquimonas sp.]|jgi:ABC-type sugar transport system substrate-binding protein|nr:substrate-binding domain-containing protein [Salaquimonas sp.]
MKKLVTLIGAAAFAVAGTTAALAADGKITIGMANLFYGAPYFAGMDAAVHEEAKVYENVEVISTDAGFDAAKMASDIEDLIAKGVDGLVVSAGPTETIPASLAAIQEAGIPVVFVDRLWKNTNLTTPWNWVGAQNDVMGQVIGEEMVKHLGGKGQILVIKGGPADNSIGIARTEAFTKALSSSPDMTITVAPGFGGWAVDGGYKVMSDMLAKMDNIDGVFCENDSMCLGAQKAAADAGRSDEMVFAASDAGKDTLREMMRDGSNFIATAINDSDQIGRVGFHHLMGMLAGGKLPHITPLYSGLVLPDEAAKIYDPNKVF